MIRITCRDLYGGYCTSLLDPIEPCGLDASSSLYTTSLSGMLPQIRLVDIVMQYRERM
jgi:hypothetical protein